MIKNIQLAVCLGCCAISAGEIENIIGEYRSVLDQSSNGSTSIYLSINGKSHKAMIINEVMGKSDTSFELNDLNALGDSLYALNWIKSYGKSKITAREQIMYYKMWRKRDTLITIPFVSVYEGANKSVYGTWKRKYLYKVENQAAKAESLSMRIIGDTTTRNSSQFQGTSKSHTRIVGDSIHWKMGPDNAAKTAKYKYMIRRDSLWTYPTPLVVKYLYQNAPKQSTPHK